MIIVIKASIGRILKAFYENLSNTHFYQTFIICKIYKLFMVETWQSALIFLFHFYPSEQQKNGNQSLLDLFIGKNENLIGIDWFEKKTIDMNTLYGEQ